MTLTLCINVAWCRDKTASCVLAHSITSILLHCLMLTARLFPSWRAGSPDSKDGDYFPRIHTYTLYTVLTCTTVHKFLLQLFEVKYSTTAPSSVLYNRSQSYPLQKLPVQSSTTAPSPGPRWKFPVLTSITAPSPILCNSSQPSPPQQLLALSTTTAPSSILFKQLPVLSGPSPVLYNSPGLSSTSVPLPYSLKPLLVQFSTTDSSPVLYNLSLQKCSVTVVKSGSGPGWLVNRQSGLHIRQFSIVCLDLKRRPHLAPGSAFFS